MVRPFWTRCRRSSASWGKAGPPVLLPAIIGAGEENRTPVFSLGISQSVFASCLVGTRLAWSAHILGSLRVARCCAQHVAVSRPSRTVGQNRSTSTSARMGSAQIVRSRTQRGSLDANDPEISSLSAFSWILTQAPSQIRRSQKRIGAGARKAGGNFGGDPGWFWFRTEGDTEALKVPPPESVTFNDQPSSSAIPLG